MRALRRAAGRSLTWVADRTQLSYSYLSRLENDSAVPGPDAVARVADALDGDLKELLELAHCLPRTILDRLMARTEDTTPVMRRAAFDVEEDAERLAMARLTVLELLQGSGLDDQAAGAIAEAARRIAHMAPQERDAILAMVQTLFRSGGH